VEVAGAGAEKRDHRSRDRRACGVSPQLWGFVFGFSFGFGFGSVLDRFWPVHYNVVALIVGATIRAMSAAPRFRPDQTQTEPFHVHNMYL